MTAYPKCVAGIRACPPYSCKEIPDYVDLLKVCEEGKYSSSDPEYFDPDKFQFSDVNFISDANRAVLNKLFLPSVHCYETCCPANHQN